MSMDELTLKAEVSRLKAQLNTVEKDRNWYRNMCDRYLKMRETGEDKALKGLDDVAGSEFHPHSPIQSGTPPRTSMISLSATQESEAGPYQKESKEHYVRHLYEKYLGCTAALMGTSQLSLPATPTKGNVPQDDDGPFAPPFAIADHQHSHVGSGHNDPRYSTGQRGSSQRNGRPGSSPSSPTSNRYANALLNSLKANSPREDQWGKGGSASKVKSPGSNTPDRRSSGKRSPARSISPSFQDAIYCDSAVQGGFFKTKDSKAPGFPCERRFTTPVGMPPSSYFMGKEFDEMQKVAKGGIEFNPSKRQITAAWNSIESMSPGPGAYSPSWSSAAPCRSPSHMR